MLDSCFITFSGSPKKKTISVHLNVNWITFGNVSCKDEDVIKKRIAFEQNFIALEDSFILRPNLRGTKKGNWEKIMPLRPRYSKNPCVRT